MFLVRVTTGWSNNVANRAVATPKVALTDTGLVAHLAGVDVDGLERAVSSTLTGGLVEGFVVTVKLTDVDALRRLASEPHPDSEQIIADSLPDAWQLAVDPFAPVRSIPGISWRKGGIVVEHRPARARVTDRTGG